MMRVFICCSCKKVRVVSKYLTADCHLCGKSMDSLDIPYVQWVDFNVEQRDDIIERFCDGKEKA